MEELHAEADEPHVKIVRPSTRRKFLTAILGSGVILGLGGPALMHLAQNVRVTLNAKDGPPDSDLELYSCSQDLNLATFVKSNHDGKLYIWNYQQQRMITLSASTPLWNTSAWSSDNKYLFYQTKKEDNSTSIDIWDIQVRQKMASYEHDMYGAADMVCWSPDGSRIALLIQDQNKLVVMTTRPLQPAFSLDIPHSTETFTWSPDSQRIALMVGSPDQSAWSVQIWDLQSRRKSQEIAFQGQVDFSYSNLIWSPDGAHIATCTHGQLQIIQTEGNLSSKLLDKSIRGRIAWSPDSKYLATVGSEAADDRGWDTLSFGAGLNVWNIAGQRKLWSSDRGFNVVPRAINWSKDGHKIIIIDNSYSHENWIGYRGNLVKQKWFLL